MAVDPKIENFWWISSSVGTDHGLNDDLSSRNLFDHLDCQMNEIVIVVILGKNSSYIWARFVAYISGISSLILYKSNSIDIPNGNLMFCACFRKIAVFLQGCMNCWFQLHILQFVWSFRSYSHEETCTLLMPILRYQVLEGRQSLWLEESWQIYVQVVSFPV
jgi:hypothetical protein